MNNQTAGSSAPIVGSKALDENGYPYELVEGIPMGAPAFRIVANPEPLDARVKCSKCDCVTHHTGVAFGSNNSETAGQALRLYCCTVCGLLTTKRG